MRYAISTLFMLVSYSICHATSGLPDLSFQPSQQLLSQFRHNLPEGWALVRHTSSPSTKELSWRLLPTLYYFHFEGPRKWRPLFYSGPRMTPEEAQKYFDERPEYVNVYVFASSPLPSKQLQLDQDTGVLWEDPPYQAIGSSHAFTWPDWKKDISAIFMRAGIVRRQD